MAPEPHELSLRARSIGVTIWASFLAACAGTMFFFAFIAPDDLVGAGSEESMVDHLGVYTLGFFGFWALGIASSALTVFLERSPWEVNRCTLDPADRPPGCPKRLTGECAPSDAPVSAPRQA